MSKQSFAFFSDWYSAVGGLAIALVLSIYHLQRPRLDLTLRQNAPEGSKTPTADCYVILRNPTLKPIDVNSFNGRFCGTLVLTKDGNKYELVDPLYQAALTEVSILDKPHRLPPGETVVFGLTLSELVLRTGFRGDSEWTNILASETKTHVMIRAIGSGYRGSPKSNVLLIPTSSLR